MTVNLLAAAMSTPILGRLGDLRGRRPVLLAVMVVVLIGSVIAAVTQNLALLLLARALQGASYGIFPLAIGVLREEMPPHRLTGAMAIVSGTLSIGGAVGLVATGLLVGDDGDYHRVFWLASALTAVGLLATWFAVPRRRTSAGGSVDWIGAGLLGGALVLLLLPLEKGDSWGWASPAVITLFTAAVAAFIILVLTERRIASPLLSTRMLSHWPLVVANVAGLLLGAAMFVAFLTISAFVQTPPALAGYGFASTVLATSVVYLLPGAAGGIITAPLGGRLVSRYGAKPTLVLALTLAASGFVFMMFLHSAGWQIILSSFVVSTGVTFGYAALPALLVEHVSPGQTGIANSVNSIARSVGSALASALVVTALSRNLIPGLPAALPQESQYVVVLSTAAVAVAAAALLVLFGLSHNSPAKPTVEAAEAEVVLTIPAPLLGQHETTPAPERPRSYRRH